MPAEGCIGQGITERWSRAAIVLEQGGRQWASVSGLPGRSDSCLTRSRLGLWVYLFVYRRGLRSD